MVTYLKVAVTATMAFITSMLGVLTIPIMLMVTCNLVDYITGLMASSYRDESISSYKSMKGVFKKVCMWLLVVVGAIVDHLLEYASDTIGFVFPFTFLVASVVAIWIICNELISIIENITDMGVNVPAFLKPLVEKIKTQTEDLTNESEDE